MYFQTQELGNAAVGATPTTCVALQAVSKSFGEGSNTVQAVDSVDLAIANGEFLSLIGPSGCGKSTLLRILAGLETASAGTLSWQGAAAKRRVGFVFQEPGLLPWKTAQDNIAFAASAFGVPPREARDRARELLSQVGLGAFGDALPKQLSGGMRQRVGIARALATDPDILLLDEPFGALDLLTRDHLNDLLAELWAATHKTIVLVTHSVEEAAYLSDRVIVMTPRPARVKREYRVELERPRGAPTKLDPAFHSLMAALRADLE